MEFNVELLFSMILLYLLGNNGYSLAHEINFFMGCFGRACLRFCSWSYGGASLDT